jgi:hypothetical protein
MIVPRENQRQCPPIYLINIMQIDPNMYTRGCSNYPCIFYHSNSKEEHHFNIFELACGQNPRESIHVFSRGTRMGIAQYMPLGTSSPLGDIFTVVIYIVIVSNFLLVLDEYL